MPPSRLDDQRQRGHSSVSSHACVPSLDWPSATIHWCGGSVMVRHGSVGGLPARTGRSGRRSRLRCGGVRHSLRRHRKVNPWPIVPFRARPERSGYFRSSTAARSICATCSHRPADLRVKLARMALSHLGQSGFRMQLGTYVVYVDPYLSDSWSGYIDRGCVTCGRRRSSRSPSSMLTWCSSLTPTSMSDPDTLSVVARNNPGADSSPPTRWRRCSPHRRGRCLAHPGGRRGQRVPARRQRRASGCQPRIRPSSAMSGGGARFLGFVIEHAGTRLYHAGDGSVHEDVIAAVRRHGPIDTALLPVNECNFFRERLGIVGNMSIREAFGLAVELGARRLVPMHFDMFAPNCVYEEEIEVVYRWQSPPVPARPAVCRHGLGQRMISVVIRTFNEEHHLGELLESIRTQSVDLGVEVILVDSGSTDRTRAIAEGMGCRIVHIDKASSARALAEPRLRCGPGRLPRVREWALHSRRHPLAAEPRGAAARGRGAVHVRPAGGRLDLQVQRRTALPALLTEHSAIPQEGFFCNNANAALRNSWAQLPFDEELTGLEDMAMAKAIVARGGAIGYVAEAPIPITCTTSPGARSATASSAKPSPCRASSAGARNVRRISPAT